MVIHVVEAIWYLHHDAHEYGRIRIEVKSSYTKWGMSDCPLCRAEQTRQHVIEVCPNVKFTEGVARLHKSEEDAVTWINNLES